MRDKTHIEHVERWARYVKENPDKWKEQLKPFLDSQILIAKRFYQELGKTEEGREKMKRLREMRKSTKENIKWGLSEKEIVEDNDMMSQIIASEKNIKKSKIREFA